MAAALRVDVVDVGAPAPVPEPVGVVMVAAVVGRVVLPVGPPGALVVATLVLVTEVTDTLPVLVALKAAHSAAPTLWAWPSSSALQAAIRQPAAARPMAPWLGPHWQATSLGAQPTAVMAVLRHGCWDAASAGRAGQGGGGRGKAYSAGRHAREVLGDGGAGGGEDDEGLHDAGGEASWVCRWGSTGSETRIGCGRRVNGWRRRGGSLGSDGRS